MHRPLVLANPFAGIVVMARDSFVLGAWPSAALLAANLATSLAVAVAGYAVFRRAQNGFSDVV